MGFPPWPMRLSLDNLVDSTSEESTILTPILVWTPDRHRHERHTNPSFNAFLHPASMSLDYRRSQTARPIDRHFYFQRVVFHILNYFIALSANCIFFYIYKTIQKCSLELYEILTPCNKCPMSFDI